MGTTGFAQSVCPLMLNRVVCGAEHGGWFGVGARAWGSAVRVGVAGTGRLPQYMVAVVILLSHLRIQLQYSPRCLLRACALPAVGPGMVAQAQEAQGAAVLEIQRARGSEGPTPRGHPLPARSSVSSPSPNGDHPPRVPWRRDLGLPLASPASVIASGPRPPTPPQPTPKTE